MKDDEHVAKEVTKSKEKGEFDDLGSLSDYEFGKLINSVSGHSAL